MKVIYSLGFLIFSLWLPSSFADCPQDWYALFCRGGGGFSLNNINPSADNSMTILEGKFRKNGHPYSRFGFKGILPGSCTWYDRIINDSEPSEISLTVYLTVIYTQVAMNLLTQCGPSSNCMMSLCAQNYSGHLVIHPLNLRTTFGTP